jgi:F420-0:gamma-glutamyl ligase
MGIFLAIPIGKAIGTLLTVTVVGGLVVFGTGVAAGTVGGAVLENQTGVVDAIGESVETGEMPSVADVVSNSQLAKNYREN